MTRRMVLFLSLFLAAGWVQANEVGTYALVVGKDGILYKINTKTGKVWSYEERWIPGPAYLKATGISRKDLDKLFREADEDGGSVYSYPYWDQTRDDVRSIEDLYIKKTP
jgi:hypothetical protein